MKERLLLMVLVLSIVGCSNSINLADNLTFSSILQEIELPPTYKKLKRTEGDAIDELGFKDNLVFSGILRTNVDGQVYYTETLLITNLDNDETKEYKLEEQARVNSLTLINETMYYIVEDGNTWQLKKYIDGKDDKLLFTRDGLDIFNPARILNHNGQAIILSMGSKGFAIYEIIEDKVVELYSDSRIDKFYNVNMSYIDKDILYMLSNEGVSTNVELFNIKDHTLEKIAIDEECHRFTVENDVITCGNQSKTSYYNLKGEEIKDDSLYVEIIDSIVRKDDLTLTETDQGEWNILVNHKKVGQIKKDLDINLSSKVVATKDYFVLSSSQGEEGALKIYKIDYKDFLNSK